MVYEGGASLERAIAALGHYPDHRNKKARNWSRSRSPRSRRAALFVASERASVVAVYDLTDPANPLLKPDPALGRQPGGLVAIPSRNLVRDGERGGRARGRVARRM